MQNQPTSPTWELTFSDLERTPSLRVSESVVGLDNRDRHAIRRSRRVSDRDGIAGWRRW